MARWTASLPLFLCLACYGQSADQPAYLNPDLAAEKRAADLVSRMTLEEKVLQMQNSAPALARLNIPAYDWWNEALHGVARAGRATVFPQAIGLAATFDTGLMHRVADIISTEARAKYNEAIRNDNHARYYGLTFWSPNINIFRDPRWGRGQETYGEDPYLTGRMAVAFIHGLQGDDPHYYKVIATAKHYAVHSGPEPSRHQFDVTPSQRDLNETYLAAFRAAIVEGKADSVMCAYNAVNGVPACASTELLQKRLRGDWGFQGYVVSDCGAISDIFRGHKYKATAAEASAVAVMAGTDLTCGNEYRSLVEAVKSGLIAENEIDRSLERLFVARFKLGMFDPPERVPFSKILYSVNDSPEHRKVALEAARKAIVLLKNDGTLPLKPTVRKIAVIGPSADDSVALLGNYNGFSSRHVTPLQGIVGYQFGGEVQVSYALGATYTSQTPSLLPDGVRTAPGGTLRPPVSGDYTFVVPGGRGGPAARLFLDDKELTDPHVTLEAGRAYALRIEASQTQRPGAGVEISWIPPAEPLLAQAVEAAKNSDVAVAFVGLNPNLEGEEMRVSIPGFAGGDRTDIKLPESQEKLIEALVATGKPVVVVLTSGSALAVNYAAGHAAAVLQLWYGGEETGTAIAETLAGENNPAGRLPVTFYRGVDQLPPFEDYAMKGRTYRYFKGDVLWGFGFGLSYSRFQYSGLRAQRTAHGAQISVKVKNESVRDGDEVVQLYFDGSGGADDAIRQLRGFVRIHLRAGETRDVRLLLAAEDVPKRKVRISVGSGQPLPQIPHVVGTL
jgi:beta-glucosidase